MLEVIGHAYTLQPDVVSLAEAARPLSADGFLVFPYTTVDLAVGKHLIAAGREAVTPWGNHWFTSGDA